MFQDTEGQKPQNPQIMAEPSHVPEGRPGAAEPGEGAAWAIECLETDKDLRRLATSPPEASEEPSDDPIDNPPQRIYLLAKPDRWGDWALEPYRRCDAEYRYVGKAGARPMPPVEPEGGER